MKNIESIVPGLQLQDVRGVCDIHGEYDSQVMVREGASDEAVCPHCAQISFREASARQAQEQTAQRFTAAREARIANIGMPDRLFGKSFDDYEPQTAAAKDHLSVCRAFSDRWIHTADIGANLILCGKPGTGKTHLVSVICREIASSHNAQPIYTTASKMLRYIRAAYGKNATYTEAEAMDKFINADLLALDEIGVKLPTEHDRSMLFEIVDERYQRRLPTIIISNLTIDEISKQTDARMVDRLSENGNLLIFDWSSYRSNASNDIEKEIV